MKKIIADNITLKVQAKAYSNELGGRKWTPTVVSQQKITFLESFTPVSAYTVYITALPLPNARLQDLFYTFRYIRQSLPHLPFQAQPFHILHP